MPIYEYISKDSEKSCRICSQGFELNRPIDRPALEVCPLCKSPVQKVISNITTPKVSKKPSISEAKSAGFTVFEKRDEGVYEKQ